MDNVSQFCARKPNKPGFVTLALERGLWPGVGQMAGKRRVGDRRSVECEMFGLGRISRQPGANRARLGMMRFNFQHLHIMLPGFGRLP